MISINIQWKFTTSGSLWFVHYLYPATDASPDVTSVSPVSILKVVVLPAPFTPRSPKHCTKHFKLNTTSLSSGSFQLKEQRYGLQMIFLVIPPQMELLHRFCPPLVVFCACMSKFRTHISAWQYWSFKILTLLQKTLQKYMLLILVHLVTYF